MSNPLEGAPDESAAARGDALRYLTHRARSEDEVRRRLLGRGHADNVVESVISWLQACGYLDDLKFAESWVESRKRTRPSGRLRLSRELEAKGVPEEMVDAALDHLLPEEREREAALALGAARAPRYRNVPKEVAKRRLGAFLMRRGFPSFLISEVLRTVVDGRETPHSDEID